MPTDRTDALEPDTVNALFAAVERHGDLILRQDGRRPLRVMVADTVTAETRNAEAQRLIDFLAGQITMRETIARRIDALLFKSGPAADVRLDPGATPKILPVADDLAELIRALPCDRNPPSETPAMIPLLDHDRAIAALVLDRAQKSAALVRVADERDRHAEERNRLSAILALLQPKALPDDEAIERLYWGDDKAGVPALHALIEGVFEYLFRRLCPLLGIEKFEAGDGSETLSGDLCASLRNLLIAGGVMDTETDEIASVGELDRLRTTLRRIYHDASDNAAGYAGTAASAVLDRLARVSKEALPPTLPATEISAAARDRARRRRLAERDDASAAAP